jgi:hypothetical protein
MMNRTTSTPVVGHTGLIQGVNMASIESIAAKTGAPLEIVRTFAKIATAENAHVFSADAAHKAFAHLRKKA